MLLSHILPVFLVISSVVDDVNAQCSYLNDRNRQRRLGANGRALQEDEDDDDEEVFDSGFRYGSMFNSTELPPFNSKSAFELIEASKAGGYMDSDQRSTSFFESPPFMTKDRFGNPTSQRVFNGLGGYTYLGQLLSHDMNKDVTSVLGVPIDPSTIKNKNKPWLDLDTMYDFGDNEPLLVDDGEGRMVFKIGQSASGLWTDFPRSSDGEAIIVDGRNDNNRMLGGIQLVFMLAHNKLMIDNNMRFDEAKLEMQHTWRSIVRTNLMEHLFDNDVLADIQRDGYVNKFYTGTIRENNGMPVEHSSAAYRLFHSRLAGAYRTRGDGQFWSVLPTSSDRKASLMGGFPSQVGQVINWNCFFGASGSCVDPRGNNAINPGRILDVLYEGDIIKQPINGPGVPENQTIVEVGIDSLKYELSGENYQLRDGTPTSNLATLDLVRSETHQVPGGIAFATYARDTLDVNVTVYTIEEMANSDMGLPEQYYIESTPTGYASVPTDVSLEIYLAYESMVEQRGTHMGKLGSYICGETIFHFLNNAPGHDENWKSVMNGDEAISFLNVVQWIGIEDKKFGGGWPWHLDIEETVFS